MRKFVFWTLLLWMWWANAEDQPMTYRIGVEDVAYYPFFDFDSADAGLLKAILEQFAAREKIRFDYISLPINRFNEWYKMARIDFRLPDHPDWHPDTDNEQLVYSDTLVDLDKGIVVAKAKAHTPLSQLKVVGTLYSFTPTLYWQQRIKDGTATLVQDSSAKVLTRLLMNGMIDGLDMQLVTIRHELQNLGMQTNQVQLNAEGPKGTLGYRLSTQKHPALISKLNLFLRDEQDSIRGLLTQYGVGKR